MERNRRVLLSIRLSTLILAVAIISAVVIGIVLINKTVNSNDKKYATSGAGVHGDRVSVAEETTVEEENIEPIVVELTPVQTVTSRSTTQPEREVSLEEETGALEQEMPIEEVLDEVEAIPVEEVQEEVIEEVVEEVPTVKIEDVKISRDMDLTVRTGLSREDFITLMAGVKADTSGFFEENAGLIYDMCEKYSLNEVFFCGLISAESGWNIAQNHRNTHNYISLMSKGGLIRYSSLEEGMEVAARTLHDRYLTEGGSCYYGKTLEAMKTRFCPGSTTWVGLVYGRMQQIIP